MFKIFFHTLSGLPHVMDLANKSVDLAETKTKELFFLLLQECSSRRMEPAGEDRGELRQAQKWEKAKYV